MRIARDTPIDEYDVAVALSVFFAIAIICRLTGSGQPEIVIDRTTGQQTERPTWRGLCRVAQIRRIFAILSEQVPKPVAALGTFSAPNPWHGDAKTNWTVNFYFYKTSWRDPPLASEFADGIKRKPNPMNEAIGIASADGRYHILPRVVSERWLQGAVANVALPALLRQLEPRLKRSDYMLHTRVTLCRAYAGFIGSIPLLLVAVIVTLWITGSGPEGETRLADLVIPGVVFAGMLGVAALLLCEPLWRRRRDRRMAALANEKIPATQGSGLPRLLYFARPFEGGQGSVVYRVSRIGVGETLSQVWRGRWVDDPDIYRRYLNGFDADVDQVTEAEAARLIGAASCQIS
jgi:hypothetical protein